MELVGAPAERKLNVSAVEVFNVGLRTVSGDGLDLYYVGVVGNVLGKDCSVCKVSSCASAGSEGEFGDLYGRRIIAVRCVVGLSAAAGSQTEAKAKSHNDRDRFLHDTASFLNKT